MTEKDNKSKGTLKIGPSKLSLTKTVESGQVKQNFQRGRSKTVTVEVRKTRTFTRDGGTMVRDNQGAANLGGLSEREREARQKVLDQLAENAATESSVNTPPIQGSVKQRQRPPEPKMPEVRPGSQEAEAAVAADAAKKKLETKTPIKKREDEADAAKKKAEKDKGDRSQKMKLDAGDRRGGKLTVTQAMNMDGEASGRMRSLASIKRQRDKAKQKMLDSGPQEKQVREVVVPEAITVQELANRMAERAIDLIKVLMKMGTMATVNQTIDPDTAELLIEEFGHRMKRVSAGDVENVLLDTGPEEEGDLQSRPPVVTVMGHVDHGKTSLLDALRKTDVVSGEAGGITQHIGAYQVQMPSGDKISFIDTPGHEAFTAMRARGAKVTDIVILVVAADDGVMPQTEEAIAHAKAAGVPIIVAINKIDKPGADPEKIKTSLMQYELVGEDFGGDVQMIEVSALAGTNLDKLEEAIVLQAEILELRANPKRTAAGVVIESKIEQGRGTVATMLVQKGTLKVGDILVAGASYGKVRAMINDHGQQVREAGPSSPVEILGLGEPPEAGDDFAVVADEKTARDITSYRSQKSKDARVAGGARTMEQLFASAGKNVAKELPVIIKADVQGSSEAISGSLQKFNSDEVAVRVIHTGVGGISESDISLAKTTGASLVAFNVRASKQAKELADKEQVSIRYYSIIYDVIDDVKAALSGLLSPRRQENFIGYAEIREVFNVTKVGKVAGCFVTEGTIKRGAGVRLLRDNVVIHEGTLKTLQRFKDAVKEVKNGYECGMAFENYDDLKVGDMIEAFEVEEVQRSVDDVASGKSA